MDSRILTLLFTDMKGFTETTGHGTRHEVLDLVRRHDDLLRPVAARFEGRILKSIGDAFLVVFESPTNAVLCGLLMQHTLREHNRTAPEKERMEIRIAINSGEVQIADNDVYGEPVNVAARINAITEPNEVYFTEAVYLSMNRNEVPSSEIGFRKLKGVAEAIKVYRVIQDPSSDQYRRAVERYAEQGPASPAPAPFVGTAALSPPAPRRPSLKRILLGFAAAAAAGAALALLMLRPADSWAEQARKFAVSGGFPDAWRTLDDQYRTKPDDPEVQKVGSEILDRELSSYQTRHEEEKALARLQEHAKDRPYLLDLPAAGVRIKKSWAVSLIEKSRKSERDDESYAQALKLLWEMVEADPDDAALRLEYVLTLAGYRHARAASVIEEIHKLTEKNESVAKDPRVRDVLLKYLRDKYPPPYYDEARLLYQYVGRRYLDDVKTDLLPLLESETDLAGRLTAFCVLGAANQLSEDQIFEVQRRNLLQTDTFHRKFQEEAAKYFEELEADGERARRLLQGKTYASIPIFETFASSELELALPALSGTLFAAFHDYFHAEVAKPGNTWKRHACLQVLEKRGEVTPEVRRRHYLLNVAEHDYGDLRWNWRPNTEAILFLQTGDLPESERREALEIVTRKQAEFREAKDDRNVFKSDDTIEWLEENLEKARAKLAGGG